jgi:hypothetical protein
VAIDGGWRRSSRILNDDGLSGARARGRAATARPTSRSSALAANMLGLQSTHSRSIAGIEAQRLRQSAAGA